MANISGYVDYAASVKAPSKTDDELYTLLGTNSKGSVVNVSKITNVTVNASTGALNANFSGNVDSATQVLVTSNSNNATHYLTFTDTNNASSNKNIHTDQGITCNPSTNTISADTFVGSLSGNALQVTTTNTNASSTFYPVFVSGAGNNQDLAIDSVTGPFSVNPNTGALNLATTIKIPGSSTGGMAIGFGAGVTQNSSSLAIGSAAGISQGLNCTAIGPGAAGTTQGNYSVAVGNNSGQTSLDSCVAVGTDAGRNLQQSGAIAIGSSAGTGTSTAGTGQAAGAVAIGVNAGASQQKTYSVAIGTEAGRYRQGMTGSTANAGSCVAIGYYAARGISESSGGQGIRSVAIGNVAGQTSQGESCVAVGDDSANSNQGNYSVAIGKNAGNLAQYTTSVAIGYDAGRFTQGYAASGLTGGCVAIGQNAGRGTGTNINNQQPAAVAVGLNAGNSNQGNSSVAIGSSGGTSNQGINCVAVGCQSGQNSQGASATAIGINAGQQSQGTSAVSVGEGAGFFNQGASSVAIGSYAGAGTALSTGSQAAYCVAVGAQAGNTSQLEGATAVGTSAGTTNQGTNATAVGILAGGTSQGTASVAIGSNAGRYNQGAQAIAIGSSAGIGVSGGSIFQGANAIAIGNGAGAGLTSGQGSSAIAIGYLAANGSQTQNSICLNASGSILNPNQTGFFVNPVRTTTALSNNIVTYNSNELTSVSILNGFPQLQEVVDPMLKRMGTTNGIVGYSYDPAFITNTNSTIAANRTYIAASYFYAGEVINNLGVVSNATSIGATELKIGLYSGAGALLTSTANLTSATSFTAGTYTFFSVTQYTIPTSGFYYFAVGAAATITTAAFSSCGIPSAAITNWPNTAAITTGAISGMRFGIFTTSGTTILPSSLNGVSVTNNGGLYLIAAT